MPCNPANISGLKVWLKADSLALSDNDPVATWTDSSGNGNNATQPTGTNQPLFKTAIINGEAVVRFDGSDNWMQAPIVHTGANLTVFIVAKRISETGGIPGNVVFVTVNPANNDYNNTDFFVLYEQLIFGTYRNGNKSIASPHPGNGVPYLFATKFDGGNNTAYLNGVAKTPVASTGAFNFETAVIAARYTGGVSNFDNIDIAELLVYDSALSDTQIGNIGHYVAAKYGLSVANTVSCDPSPSFPHNMARRVKVGAGMSRSDSAR